MIRKCINAFQTQDASVRGRHKYNPSLVTTAGHIAAGLEDLHAAFRMKAQEELEEEKSYQEVKKACIEAFLSAGEEQGSATGGRKRKSRSASVASVEEDSKAEAKVEEKEEEKEHMKPMKKAKAAKKAVPKKKKGKKK